MQCGTAPDVPRRCEWYKPLKGLQDQRTGLQRGWTKAKLDAVDEAKVFADKAEGVTHE
jgi:hypothetical protein